MFHPFETRGNCILVALFPGVILHIARTRWQLLSDHHVNIGRIRINSINRGGFVLDVVQKRPTSATDIEHVGTREIDQLQRGSMPIVQANDVTFDFLLLCLVKHSPFSSRKDQLHQISQGYSVGEALETPVWVRKY